MPTLMPWSIPNRKKAVMMDSDVSTVRMGLRRRADHTR